MKKWWIIGIILLIILIILTAGLLMLTEKKEICGPAFLGGGRNISYCDISCQIDSDCKSICGCGVINKDEVCDTTGAEVDCLAPGEIKCIEGKCVESKNPPVDVIISTDKTTYMPREEVKITIESPKEVYFYNYYYNAIETAFDIRRLSGSEWNSLPLGCSNSCQCINGALMCADIAPAPQALVVLESPYSFSWNQLYCLYEEKKCGNYSYNYGAIKEINQSMQLRARFCYYEKEDVNPERPVPENLSKQKCVETDFVVNP